MTKELIRKLAKDAGLFTHKEVQPELEAFAKLVADAEAKRMQDEGMVTIGHMREQVAKEREACAQICEKFAPTTTPTWVSYAAAIRARGNNA
jgi:hypothetical protein